MSDPHEQVPFFGKKFREKRLEGEREGEKKGREKGKKEGRKEGKKEGKEEGAIIAFRKTILAGVANRFGSNGHRKGANGKLARMVHAIDESRKLEAIFRRALKAKSLETVVAMLEIAQPLAKPKAAKAQPVS